MITPRRKIRPADVAGHYDELDRIYREIWGEHVHHGLWITGSEDVPSATRNLVARVAEGLDLQRGSTVCDVGCGYGATSRLLAAEYGARVTGVTLSRAQFDFAVAATAGDNPRFVCMDFLENSFDDGSFDAVLAIESTEHFEDKPRLVREMFRILRPGGRLAICAWLAAENPSAWQTRTLLEPICAEGQLAGLGSETEYDGLLRQAEFDGIEFIDLTPCVARTWTIICRRVLMRLARDRATWRFLARRPKNAVFGLAIPRIVLAYRTRAMRYGLFVARRPERGGRMVESTSARAESRA